MQFVKLIDIVFYYKLLPTNWKEIDLNQYLTLNWTKEEENILISSLFSFEFDWFERHVICVNTFLLKTNYENCLSNKQTNETRMRIANLLQI